MKSLFLILCSIWTIINILSSLGEIAAGGSLTHQIFWAANVMFGIVVLIVLKETSAELEK